MFARISEVFRIFFSRIALLSAIAFTVWLPACLLMAILENTSLVGPGATDQVSALAGLVAPISIGALIFAVSKIQGGGNPGYTEAITIGLKRWSKLLVARFCANVIIGLGYLALILPGIVLQIRYSLLEASVVVEDAGVAQSRKRSWQLTRGMMWDIFTATIVLGLVFVLIFLLALSLYAGTEPPLSLLTATLIFCVPGAFNGLLAILLFGFYLEGTSHEDAENAGSVGRRAVSGRAHIALIPIIALLALVPAARSVFADWNDVPTGAMTPTIVPGDRIFLHKSAYDLRTPFTARRLISFKEPQVGDIVVMLSPEDGKRLVERIVGVPGDTIEFQDDFRLYRNGTPAVYSEVPEAAAVESHDHPVVRILQEELQGREYLIKVIMASRLYPNATPPNCLTEGASHDRTRFSRWFCVLGDGEYFVLGDNRNNSRDSRYFGPVDRSAILGRVTAVVLSFDRQSFFKPRWDRFFAGLD